MTEKKITTHQPGGILKPLVMKNRVQYPKNPENGYVSRRPANFRECLGCGYSQHHFNSFPQSADKNVRSTYWQELWCHIPSSRKGDAGDRKNREKQLHILLHAALSINNIVPQKDLMELSRGQGINNPAWMDRTKQQQASNPPHQFGSNDELMNHTSNTHGFFQC